LATAAQEAEAVGACSLLPIVAAPEEGEEEEEEEEEAVVRMGFVPKHLARRGRYAASLYGGSPADTPVPSGRTSSHPEGPTLDPITITPTRLSLLLAALDRPMREVMESRDVVTLCSPLTVS
jgi:hypothetical protein